MSIFLWVSFPMQQVFPITLSHSNSVVFIRTCSSSLLLVPTYDAGSAASGQVLNAGCLLSFVHACYWAL